MYGVGFPAMELDYEHPFCYYQTDSPFEYDLIRFRYKTQNEKLKSTHAETEGASNRIEVFFLL